MRSAKLAKFMITLLRYVRQYRPNLFYKYGVSVYTDMSVQAQTRYTIGLDTVIIACTLKFVQSVVLPSVYILSLSVLLRLLCRGLLRGE